MNEQVKPVVAAGAEPVRSVGEYVPMVDGPEKASGRAKYTADFVGADALEAAIYRSPYAHARILEVDTSEAEATPGVRAVVTGNDCDKTYGVLPIARGEYPLARERVRYKGEPVAAVAADDIHIAKAAIKKIRLRVRELPAYFRAKDAYAEGAIDLHEHRPGNLEREVFFELGDVEQA
ncbi:MAG: 4-hydroxybenzoyl-CoA reductase subunit alpha, partial [Rhodospirillaceae bacterium]|nr:4-hydroxybenzoyl-CoA reductase subunit alpha [Rhodospirillaceae bacterium]